MKKKGKIVLLILLVLTIVISGLIIVNKVMNYYSVPSKEVRISNMMRFQEKNCMDENDVANEIGFALEKYTNWDNLFLSEHFKEKYKNRNAIVDDTSRIDSISCYSDKNYGLDNIIVINVKYKKGLFQDETEAKTTKYYYQYELDMNGEIDDLILIDRENVYTFDGEPID